MITGNLPAMVAVGIAARRKPGFFGRLFGKKGEPNEPEESQEWTVLSGNEFFSHFRFKYEIAEPGWCRIKYLIVTTLSKGDRKEDQYVNHSGVWSCFPTFKKIPFGGARSESLQQIENIIEYERFFGPVNPRVTSEQLKES